MGADLPAVVRGVSGGVRTGGTLSPRRDPHRPGLRPMGVEVGSRDYSKNATVRNSTLCRAMGVFTEG